jgi:predicted alpha/beta superfamily hydrolase
MGRVPGLGALLAIFCATPVGAAAQSAADTIIINSKILHQERAAFVALPASHAATKRTYPVVLVLDGEYNFTSARTIASTLASLGHFPEAIVVGLPNASRRNDDRVHDMTPPGLSVSGSSRNEGGDRFLDFIEQELLTTIRSRYRGGAPVILVGHSSGGVIATYAAATRAASFPVVVAIDAPIHLDDHWLSTKLASSARAARPSALRYVSLEARFGWTDSTWNALRAAAPPGWKLRREKLEGESHESMFFLAMYQGLKLAFSDYSIVGAPLVPRATASAAFEHYSKLAAEFKTELPPPAPVLRQLIEDLLTEKSTQPARRAFDWLVQGYGPQNDQADLEQMITMIEKLPPLPVTVAELQATTPPSAQELRPYIGTWRGRASLNENATWSMTLRIRVDGSRVIAETEGRSPGTFRPVDYIKVLEDGLEFGNMNGMRPMGMIVNKGKLSGNVLEGEGQFRGIVLPLPDGHMPPVMHFRLEKQ